MSNRRLLAVVGSVAVIVSASSVAFFWKPPAADQENPEALFSHALAALNSGSTDGVEIALKRLKADKKYWRHLAVLDAVLFLRSGRPEDALRRLSTEPEDSHVREMCLRYAGEAYYAIQQPGQAKLVFEMLRHEFPENTDVGKWLGAIYYDLGAYDAAITELNLVVEKVPQDFGPYHLLGIMYQDFEASEDAIRCFRAALERNPPAGKKAEIQIELARVLIADRQYDDAAGMLESVPDSAISFRLKARVCWNQGQPDDAMRHLEAARQLSPLDADGLHLTAEIEEQQGNLQGSISILERLVNDFPDRLESRYQFAMALKQAGREDESAKQLAVWQEHRELADQLIQLNLKAVSDPSDADVRDQLADVCDHLGRTKLSEMWRKAAEACRQKAGDATPSTTPPIPSPATTSSDRN